MVTGWRQSIVREGIPIQRRLFIVRHSRLSESGTETLGHWFDPIDRLKGVQTYGQWLNAVDRQRGDTEEFGHWFDTVHRQRRSTETFGFWLDTTLNRQRWVLRHFVTD